MNNFCSWKIRAKMAQFCRGLVPFLVFKVNTFWIYLSYFITFSFIGFLALKFSNPSSSSFKLKDIDAFFTSVSSVTTSSMLTVEMEVFSNTQLIFMTILMFLGGEVLLSFLELVVMYHKLPKNQTTTNNDHQIELGLGSYDPNSTLTPSRQSQSHITLENINDIKYKSIKYLCYVVLSYIIVIHLCGYRVVSLYMSLIPSAGQILKNKAIHLHTFSIFTTVSTFTNCGFIPTNENLIVFKKYSGLLLLLIPQTLLGNTLYPICLRFLIWVLKKTTRRVEFEYLLKNCKEIGFGHLFSRSYSSNIGVTAIGFIILQMVLFCSLEWNSTEIDGLSSYKKFVASFFQIISSRHSGENVVDLGNISSAMLVIFVVMMYLPPYVSLLSRRNTENDSRNCKQKSYGKCLIFSPLCVLATFIVIICITEKDKIKGDPVNFSVLNITFEVISAYSNVGFTTGYHCNMQLKPESTCRDNWSGFVGRWSNEGKLILIVVMFYGKLWNLTRKAGDV